MATIKSRDQKITPCFWVSENAEEAVKFYVSTFKNSKIGKVAYYGDAGPMPPGTVLTIEFKIEGQEFLMLNGGSHFKFNEAISFMVNCKTQKEIDYYWDNLSRGGEESVCGWLKDKFGVSWQIVPTIIGKMLTDKNPEKSARVMDAVFKMKKLDIKTLLVAYSGKSK